MYKVRNLGCMALQADIFVLRGLKVLQIKIIVQEKTRALLDAEGGTEVENR